MMGASVTITRHTTASKPNLHVVYAVEIVMNGSSLTIERRYSEFVALHNVLNDEFSLPAKRLLTTSLFPSGWIDDMLLAERKAGLAEYLSALLWSPEYQTAPALIDFLKRDTTNPRIAVDLEDYLPSTLSRKSAVRLERTASAKYELNGVFHASAYYPSWAADSVPPETVDYGKYDIVFFAYATPNSTATLDWSADTRAILQRVVKSAADSEAATKIVLAIGGSEGSQWFSHICSTATKRIAFVATIVATVKEFGLAGVAIDWETPNLKAFGNPYSPTDAANLLKLLKALRSALGVASIISAAVGRLPWIGEDGFASTDVSEFSEQLSFINIMNYGASATGNPMAHSSLGNAEDDVKTPSTAEGAISAWISAGFASSKILLGIPLFGYVYKTRKTSLTPISALDSFASSTFIGSHKEISPKLPTNTYISTKSLSVWRGLQTPFKDIVKSGALVKRFDGNYGQGDGYTLAWDDVSSTPYLFNTEKRTLVVFDNTRSIAAKVHFAKAKGLGGCCTWSLDQDDGTTLQDVIHTAIGE